MTNRSLAGSAKGSPSMSIRSTTPAPAFRTVTLNSQGKRITTVSISCSKSQTIAPPHSECRVAIRSTHQVRDFGQRFSIARRQTGNSFTGTVLFFRSSHQMTRSCQRIHFEMRMGDSDSTSTSPSPLSPIRFEIIPTPM